MSFGDSNSPLRLFVLAKKQITEIYENLLSYVNNVEVFLKETEDYNHNLVDDKDLKLVNEYKDKIKGILDIISRNHMKVAFFGRTSNGKSTVINAMLGEKVLPSGIGHTTNCFVQVEGIGTEIDINGSDVGTSQDKSKTKLYVSKPVKNDELEPYIYMEGDPVGARKSINSVGQLANALESQKLSHDALVHVCWPKDKCSLLRDDLILVDSPGIDVSPDVDNWIDKHCQDADVFILVANSESTLMQTEKNFFHKVATKLSAPNIFVLNNRWDASASEPETIKQVFSQHTQRVVDFLTRELDVMDIQETGQRIFFVSAKETLLIRLANKKNANNTSRSLSDIRTIDPIALKLAEGYQERMAAFVDFEKSFEECISRSALRTKFEKHSHQAKTLYNNLDNILEYSADRLARERERLVERNVNKSAQLKLIATASDDLAARFSRKAASLGHEVERRVSEALAKEIERLSAMVDEFRLPGCSFDSSRPDKMATYKARLNAYLEDGLSRNISARCLADTFKAVETFKREMTSAFSSILPQLKVSGTINQFETSSSGVDSPSEPHEPLLPALSSTTASVLETAFHLDCRNVCNNFRENLEFNFSLSPERLLKRILLPFVYRCGPTGTFNTFSSHHLLSDDGSESSIDGFKSDANEKTSFSGQRRHTIPDAKAFSSSNYDSGSIVSTIPVMGLRELRLLTSSASVGMGSIIFLSWRFVGWRLVVICASAYAGLYAYERLTWTSGVRERAFKRQFVAFAAARLRSISAQAAAHCGSHVTQDAKATLQHLTHGAELRSSTLKQDLSRDRTRIAGAEALLGMGVDDARGQSLNALKHRGTLLAAAIEAFVRQYFTASPL